MISRIDMKGYLIENDTAARIADCLKEYVDMLEERLRSKSNKDARSELAIKCVIAEEFCEILRGYYEENDG